MPQGCPTIRRPQCPVQGGRRLAIRAARCGQAADARPVEVQIACAVPANHRKSCDTISGWPCKIVSACVRRPARGKSSSVGRSSPPRASSRHSWRERVWLCGPGVPLRGTALYMWRCRVGHSSKSTVWRPLHCLQPLLRARERCQCGRPGPEESCTGGPNQKTLITTCPHFCCLYSPALAEAAPLAFAVTWT